ncbi:MAG: TatD family hydrolase [Nanoarchaeota archaeon]|nr:TatD family hydrolase [Nanoarchaeota archaeon]MBU4456514.1 TatD family hydrolase [Nanoarchaeota archaeon]MCG2719310.1 TatD family hydrolase [Nanoarchaeota archaeon]
MLVDIHCHLDFEGFNDLNEVIERAKGAGVIFIINNGISKKSNRKTLELVGKYDVIKPALGLYPDEALKMNDRQIKSEIEFIKKSKPIAIGEVGLDGMRVPNMIRQKEVFQKFIDLAKELDIPIIVHSRQAEETAVEMLEKSKVKKVIMHCFNGSLKLAKRIEKHGWYFSIPPIICYANQFKDLVKEVSSNYLLTETDSPFLSHEKGKRNEPMNVKETLKVIAEIKQIEVEEAEKIIFMNYKRLFG